MVLKTDHSQSNYFLVIFCKKRYFSIYSSRHGIGRIDIVENRFVGMKSRGERGGIILKDDFRQF